MSERPQLLYCQDILESGMAIQSYVQGMTCDEFVQDCMRYSAEYHSKRFAPDAGCCSGDSKGN